METFLLPSLIGGLLWMSSHALTQTHNDSDAMMRIFREVISSVPSSGDAQAMHSAILGIVSSCLEKCFRTIQRRDANRANNIEPLLQAIKGNLYSERSMYASMKELEQWTNAPNSTLHTSLRHTVQQLSQWASTASIQPNPPSYTHRQVYASLKILGANKVIKAIVDELKAQTEASNGAAALDVGVSMICTPTVDDSPIPVDWLSSPIPASHPPRTRMNLREMLKHEFDNAAGIVATDPLAAETIVRLHRRVEAQLSSIAENALQGQGPVMDLPNVSMGDMQSQTIPDEITKAIDDAAAASIADDITNMDNKALQRSMEELTGADGLDLSSIGMGTGDAGTDDMGAELGNLPDLDLGDMSGMGMDMDMDMAMGGGGDDDWGLDFDNM
jgi:mediator of RNA polymerase II transcription subunit 5